MSNLWSQYINDSALKHVINYFLAHVDDEEVRSILVKALKSANQHIDFLIEFFNREGFPTPIGFTENDVNAEAPRLFSDIFYLYYLSHMSIIGMQSGGLAISTVSREDIVQFFKNVTQDATVLNCDIKKMMQEKGIHNRPPYIPIPKEAKFVRDQDYLGKMFGKQRVINSVELTHIFLNIQTNTIGNSLIVAFAQVCQSEEVLGYFVRGKEISQKHKMVFSQILETNDIPSPSMWDTAVMDSTVSPFSDKLMLFQITAMSAAGIGNYGVALAASPRRDIGLKYARLLTEISLYAEDGANIMIKNGWLEEPPQAPDRDELIK